MCVQCSLFGVVASSPSKYSSHYPLQTHQCAVPNAARWNTKNMNFLSAGIAFPTIADIYGNMQQSYGSTTRDRLISYWFFLLKTPATNHQAPTSVLFPVQVPTLMSHVTNHKLPQVVGI